MPRAQEARLESNVGRLRVRPKMGPASRDPCETMSETDTSGPMPEKALSPEAQRALAEAAERRAAIDARAAELAKAKEHKGRGGLEPVRYEDWEVKGLASDF
jgi:hypothetical protein